MNMTTTTDEQDQNKSLCAECGAVKAQWAVCFDIVKRYAINDDGDAIWSDGEVIQNENDPILMCADCAREYEA